MVLFLNGVPLATMELKNSLTGQVMADAEKQYRTARDSADLKQRLYQAYREQSSAPA